MRNQINWSDPKSFAYDKGFIPAAADPKPSHVGRLLVICGTEYQAWSYDTYIYEACEIAKHWPAEHRTYERIVHLRYWIRENIQHGHDYSTSNIRSMAAAKKFIDRVIESEYRDPMWETERKFQLQENRKYFTTSKPQ
jgi:hypothetical protein